MPKIVTVTVDSCGACPLMQNADTQSYSMGFCTKAKNYVGKNDMPNWCPLPDQTDESQSTTKADQP